MLFVALVAAFVVARSAHAAATRASSFAGSPTSAVFPPPGADITSDASFFPDATQVNVFGPTPSISFLSEISECPSVTSRR
jgi:hypothetical protein